MIYARDLGESLFIDLKGFVRRAFKEEVGPRASFTNEASGVVLVPAGVDIHIFQTDW